MNTSTRISNFDGLRGIAILLVVWCHFFGYLIDGHNLTSNNFLTNIFNYGAFGVQLFFIISGFVISFTLHRYHSLSFFVIARFARLYPVYWCSVGLLFLLSFVGWKHYDLWLHLRSLTMLPLILDREAHLIGPYWTLEYELFFYTIIAVIFYFGGFAKHRYFIGWLTLALLFRFIPLPLHHPMMMYIFSLALTYAPLFIFGIYLHKIFQYGWNKAFAGMLLMSSLAYMFIYQNTDSPELNMMIAKGCFAILFALSIFAIWKPNSTILSNRYLVFCGRISYSWYLTHYALGFLIIKALLVYLPSLLSVIISFISSMLFAYFFFSCFETPLNAFFLEKGLRLRKRFVSDEHKAS